MELFKNSVMIIWICLVDRLAASELFKNLDEKEVSSIAYRLQDEKEQRLLLRNDVDIMMLKIGQMERKIEEIGNAKTKPKTHVCPDGWNRHENSCYYFSQAALSWLDAAIACKQRGGHLAVIGSNSDNEYLTAEALKLGERLWIDGTDIFSEGDWIWATKMEKIFNFTAWATGQPDNGGGLEHCLEFNWGSDHGWNDSQCGSKRKYICEMEL